MKANSQQHGRQPLQLFTERPAKDATKFSKCAGTQGGCRMSLLPFNRVIFATQLVLREDTNSFLPWILGVTWAGVPNRREAIGLLLKSAPSLCSVAFC